ncbi:MAG: GNAT family N-acetyltransferase [Polyangiaceae bacterium]|nr:GNAT family N-acetyltransferase [Polyangiaceae bacterium]
MIDAPPRAVPPPGPSIVRIGGELTIRIRCLTPADEEALRYGIEHLSAQTSYQRFLAVRKGASDAELHYLTHPDGIQHLALGAELIGLEPAEHSGIAVARSIFLPESADMAEYAIAVADEFQGRGVGSVLLQHLSEWAQRTGVRRWIGVQLATNSGIVRATSRVATEIERRPMSDGVVEVIWELHPIENVGATRSEDDRERPMKRGS